MSKPVLIQGADGMFILLDSIVMIELSYRGWDLILRSKKMRITKRFLTKEARDEFLKQYFGIIE